MFLITLLHNYIKVPESSSVMERDNLGIGKQEKTTGVYW